MNDVSGCRKCGRHDCAKWMGNILFNFRWNFWDCELSPILLPFEGVPTLAVEKLQLRVRITNRAAWRTAMVCLPPLPNVVGFIKWTAFCTFKWTWGWAETPSFMTRAPSNFLPSPKCFVNRSHRILGVHSFPCSSTDRLISEIVTRVAVALYRCRADGSQSYSGLTTTLAVV